MAYTTFNPYLDGYIISYPNGDVSLERQPLEFSGDYLVHTVLEGETIQSIAFRYYGDSGYWFYIADINNIFNSFVDLVEGMELLIPKI